MLGGGGGGGHIGGDVCTVLVKVGVIYDFRYWLSKWLGNRRHRGGKERLRRGR